MIRDGRNRDDGFYEARLALGASNVGCIVYARDVVSYYCSSRFMMCFFV